MENTYFEDFVSYCVCVCSGYLQIPEEDINPWQSELQAVVNSLARIVVGVLLPCFVSRRERIVKACGPETLQSGLVSGDLKFKPKFQG